VDANNTLLRPGVSPLDIEATRSCKDNSKKIPQGGIAQQAGGRWLPRRQVLAESFDLKPDEKAVTGLG
jgi:hypothetical protein